MYKGLLIALILILSSTAFARPQTICGQEDDRVLSFESKIGRLSITGKHKGCTVTMISESCGISAGHCFEVLEVAEFNTPVSVNGEPQPSAEEDVYKIDPSTIQYQDEGPGNDWAVFKVKANKITGKLPGTVQGYYDVSFRKPAKGIELRITGYGRDEADLDKNFAQQTHLGKLTKNGSLFLGSLLQHTVDTMGGNSGSTIINEASQKVIGIHTHGGCASYGGANSGTLISGHDRLKKAIKACIQSR